MGVIRIQTCGSGARFGVAAIALLGLAACVPARTPAPATVLAAAAPPPGGCEMPARERASEIGCWLTAVEPLGVLPGTPLFWHLDQFSSRAAAEAAKGPRGTVVESFGRVLLYTIAEEGWRPTGGRRVAAIGPLPHQGGRPYTARYMEGVFTPGMLTTAHRHSGAEAWYLFEGAQCLETPAGITTIRAGESAMVQAGPPMVLNHVGSETRRSVLLVLHESSEPWITRVSDWTPRGLCPKELPAGTAR
jgi:quercetin dioxygenase-like cupin family protein